MTSGATFPTTVTAATPRSARHRARWRTRRRTASRARSPSARRSRTGPVASRRGRAMPPPELRQPRQRRRPASASTPDAAAYRGPAGAAPSNPGAAGRVDGHGVTGTGPRRRARSRRAGTGDDASTGATTTAPGAIRRATGRRPRPGSRALRRVAVAPRRHRTSCPDGSEPGQGLAGSPADQLAGGPPPRPAPASLPAGPPRREAIRSDADHPHDSDAEPDFDARDLPRPAVPPRRPRAYDQHLGGPSSGPDWERPRRYEAYPTIKTRIGMPHIPQLGVMAVALALAALALFFLPDAAELRRRQPADRHAVTDGTPVPLARPDAHTAADADRLRHQGGATRSRRSRWRTESRSRSCWPRTPTIKDPNKIAEGQQITIPPPDPRCRTSSADHRRRPPSRAVGLVGRR